MIVSRSLQVLQLMTVLMLTVGSALKWLSIDSNTPAVYVVAACIEPLLAVYIFFQGRTVIAKFSMSFVFATFAIYSVFNVPSTERCPCFGGFIRLVGWQIVLIDVAFSLAWLSSTADCLNMKVFVGILAVSSLCAVVFRVSQRPSTKLNLDLVRVFDIKGEDRLVVEDAKSAYFLNSNCYRCVQGAQSYVATCQANSVNGVVISSIYSKMQPELESEYVKVILVPATEMALASYPPTVVLSNGRIKSIPGQPAKDRKR